MPELAPCFTGRRGWRRVPSKGASRPDARLALIDAALAELSLHLAVA